MQIVRIKNRAHISQAMPCDGSDLRFGTFLKREPRYGSPTKIVECHPDNADFRGRLTPRRAESIAGPRPLIRRCEDYWATLGGRIERGLQWSTVVNGGLKGL